jgi:hypothetical protein
VLFTIFIPVVKDGSVVEFFSISFGVLEKSVCMFVTPGKLVKAG